MSCILLEQPVSCHWLLPSMNRGCTNNQVLKTRNWFWCPKTPNRSFFYFLLSDQKTLIVGRECISTHRIIMDRHIITVRWALCESRLAGLNNVTKFNKICTMLTYFIGSTPHIRNFEPLWCHQFPYLGNHCRCQNKPTAPKMQHKFHSLWWVSESCLYLFRKLSESITETSIP